MNSVALFTNEDVASLARGNPIFADAGFGGSIHSGGHPGYNPNWETCGGDLIVASLAERPIDAPAFPGYRDVRITMPLLRRLIAAGAPDWQAALAAVGGVYLITDGEGRQYVGSASGDGGFWARWSDYAATGHGGNTGLRDLNADAFTFAILETADTRTSREDVLQRETHWKTTLGSRATGLNAN